MKIHLQNCAQALQTHKTKELVHSSMFKKFLK